MINDTLKTESYKSLMSFFKANGMDELCFCSMITEECCYWKKTVANWEYDGESLAVVYNDYSVDIFHFTL